MKKGMNIAIVCFLVLSVFTLAFAEDEGRTTTVVWEKIKYDAYGTERLIKVSIEGVVGEKLEDGRVSYVEYDVNYLDTYQDDEKYFKYEDNKFVWNGEGEFVKNQLMVIPVAPGAKLKIEVLDGGENLEFFPGDYPFVDFDKKVLVNGMGQVDNYSTETTFNKKLADSEFKVINQMPIVIAGQKYGIVVVDPATYTLPSEQKAEEVKPVEEQVVTEEKPVEETTIVEETKESGLSNFKKVKTYEEGIFIDVDATKWYAPSIKTTYELGILGGKGEGIFDPAGKIKVCEAIAMVSRTKDIFAGGTGTIENDGINWYDGFVKYATENGVIVAEQFNDYNRNASRAELAYLFAVALGEDCYNSINTVTKIADVDDTVTYNKEIFKLYNAGIITGSDEYGTFSPLAEITRSEASALIDRLINTDKRKTVVLKEK